MFSEKDKDDVAHGRVRFVKRSHAARALDALVTEYAKGSFDGASKIAVRNILANAGIDVTEYRGCDGEAHSNPHIDNCNQCAPRWGVVGPTIKVV